MASFPCHRDLIMRTSGGAYGRGAAETGEIKRTGIRLAKLAPMTGGAYLRGACLPSRDGVSVWICRRLCNLLAPVPQSQEIVDLALSPTPGPWLQAYRRRHPLSNWDTPKVT
jgi:hypothetical protein